MVVHLARSECEGSNAKRMGLMIICCGITMKIAGTDCDDVDTDTDWLR
jgi:hypothetical protein